VPLAGNPGGWPTNFEHLRETKDLAAAIQPIPRRLLQIAVDRATKLPMNHSL
jgi:hypothetical protein